MNTNTIFVYGTLRKGFGNYKYFLEGKSKFIEEDTINGKMHSWGSFPAVFPGDDTIHGEIYEVDDEVLSSLDRLEGHPNFYCRTPIKTSSGKDVEVYLCQRTATYDDFPYIPGGDWKHYVKNKGI